MSSHAEIAAGQEWNRGRFARALVGVGCIAGAILMIELALTRIFSVTMYYHFAFLAISIALFGLSASGVYVYVARNALNRRSTADRVDDALAAVCGGDGACACGARPYSSRAQLQPRKPREDDRHLLPGGDAVFHRWRGDFSGDRPAQRIGSTSSTAPT